VAAWEGSFRVELSEVGSLFRGNKSGYYCTGDLPGSVTGAWSKYPVLRCSPGLAGERRRPPHRLRGQARAGACLPGLAWWRHLLAVVGGRAAVTPRADVSRQGARRGAGGLGVPRRPAPWQAALARPRGLGRGSVGGRGGRSRRRVRHATREWGQGAGALDPADLCPKPFDLGSLG
jgi:hypothetical protein